MDGLVESDYWKIKERADGREVSKEWHALA
jgi:hypothetical protein